MAEALLDAQAFLASLSTSAALRGAAMCVTDAAAAADCGVLVPASASSHGVVAAAVLLADGDLRQAGEGAVLSGAVDKVMVVEAAAVSGLHVRRRVCGLRAAGAAWVGLVVLHDVVPAGPRAVGYNEVARFGVVDHLVYGQVATCAASTA